MSAEWWARKLQGVRQAPPPQAVTYAPAPPVQQPQYAPMPNVVVPPGYMLVPAQPPQDIDPDDIQVTKDNVVQLMLSDIWKGGKGTKTETENCPECGGAQYFSRMNTESGGARRTPPQPHCWDCGYPLVQSGSPHGALGGVQASGPPKSAPQIADKPVYNRVLGMFQ